MDTAPHQARVPVIGLVGTVGAGKSAVAAVLADLGAAVFDADSEAKSLLDDPAIQRTIAARVSDRAVVGGRVDRAALAEVVFSNEKARRALERILHPAVIERAERLAHQPPAGARAVVIDAPLLFEAGLDRVCSTVWCVDAPRAVRLARVTEHRGWTVDELDRRERVQRPIEEKRRASAVVIDNDADLAALRARVQDAWRGLVGSD